MLLIAVQYGCFSKSLQCNIFIRRYLWRFVKNLDFHKRLKGRRIDQFFLESGRMGNRIPYESELTEKQRRFEAIIIITVRKNHYYNNSKRTKS